MGRFVFGREGEEGKRRKKGLSLRGRRGEGNGAIAPDRGLLVPFIICIVLHLGVRGREN